MLYLLFFTTQKINPRLTDHIEGREWYSVFDKLLNKDELVVISAHFDHLGIGVPAMGITSITEPWIMPPE